MELSVLLDYIFHSRDMTAIKYSYAAKLKASFPTPWSQHLRHVTRACKTRVGIHGSGRASLLLLSCYDERQFVV